MPGRQAAEEESVPAVEAEADSVADAADVVGVVEVVEAAAEVDMRLVVDTVAVDLHIECAAPPERVLDASSSAEEHVALAVVVEEQEPGLVALAAALEQAA